MEEINKKYIPMENVLTKINSKAIALSKYETTRNNKIMTQVPKTIIDLMKKDTLFQGIYQRNFYGGSYYDKLKVGQPNEYDLDLVLILPVESKPCVNSTDVPGFVQVEIQDFSKLMNENKKLETVLLAEKYLSTKKVLSWFESVINVSLKSLPKEGTEPYVDVVTDETKSDESLRIYVKLSKLGPAFTINLYGKDVDGSNILLDIDLVPCFQFTDEKWPAKEDGYRSNTNTLRNTFFVVPKTPTGVKISLDLEKYWRLSFQEQERDIFNKNLRNLKPSLKLLKQLRDKHKHNIASYFIKTIFLWAVDEKDETFWGQPLSVVFMCMLKEYADRLREKNIPYYWNSRLNLIGTLKDSTKTDLANKLRNIIADVDRNLLEPSIDPFTIAKYLLLPAEFEQFKDEVPLGKKIKKSFPAAVVDITDSKVDTSPPVVKFLNFEQDTVDALRQYSDLFEERRKRDFEDMMAQINSRSNGNNNDVLTFLQKLDEKMTNILEKFEKSEENNQEINSRLASLEDQIEKLQVENNSLKRKINESEAVDSIEASDAV